MNEERKAVLLDIIRKLSNESLVEMNDLVDLQRVLSEHESENAQHAETTGEARSLPLGLWFRVESQGTAEGAPVPFVQPT